MYIYIYIYHASSYNIGLRAEPPVRPARAPARHRPPINNTTTNNNNGNSIILITITIHINSGRTYKK